MADGNFPEEMDWFISLVMPETMLVIVVFRWLIYTKLELFAKTTTSLYGSCIQIYCCLHFSVKLEHKLIILSYQHTILILLKQRV